MQTAIVPTEIFYSLATPPSPNLLSSSHPLLSSLLPFSSPNSPPSLSLHSLLSSFCSNVIVYRPKQLPWPVICFTLIFMKKREDGEDEVGEVAWGRKKTIQQRWKKRRWEKREARGRGDGEEVSDESQLKTSCRVTHQCETISWTDFEKKTSLTRF